MGYEGYCINMETTAFLSNKTDEEMYKHIIIDPITKKTQLIFSKKRC
jgi:hypothetical protein